MSEESWGKDHLEAQKPPRSVPVWVWACGSGCLLTIVALVVLGYFGWRLIQQSTDPAVQWARLAEVLPYDEPAPPMTLVGLPSMRGVRIWQLTSSDRQMQATIVQVNDDVEETRQGFLEPERGGQAIPFLGVLGVFAAEKGTARVQGRELPYVRFQTFPPESETEPAPEETEEREGRPGVLEGMRGAVRGTTMHVDLRPGSTGEGLFLQLTKPGSREPVTEEALRQFLEPFHVGPER